MIAILNSCFSRKLNDKFPNGKIWEKEKYVIALTFLSDRRRKRTRTYYSNDIFSSKLILVPPEFLRQIILEGYTINHSLKRKSTLHTWLKTFSPKVNVIDLKNFMCIVSIDEVSQKKAIMRTLDKLLKRSTIWYVSSTIFCQPSIW